MNIAQRLSDHDYHRVSGFLKASTGIHLGAVKKPLVSGRLQRRIAELGFADYASYVDHILVSGDAPERQRAIDLLTTNETYFWREPAHFAALAEFARDAARDGREFRVWSAACSSGEEAYSIAMCLQALCDEGALQRYHVLGSDISRRVLERALRAQYPLQRAQQLPAEYLRRYCRRGLGDAAGSLLVDAPLRARVEFAAINLMALPPLGRFDAIFLRNVLIYFEPSTRRAVIERVVQHLNPQGRLYLGLAESPGGALAGLRSVEPGVYRRCAAP